MDGIHRLPDVWRRVFHVGGDYFWLQNNVTFPKMFSLFLIQMLSLIFEWPKYKQGVNKRYRNTESRKSVDRSNVDLTVLCWRNRGGERTAYDRGDTTIHISVTIFQICRTYQLHWQRCCNCPPSLSIHFWDLFIKYPITCCSSPLLMLLISSWILRFSSSRVRGLFCTQHFSFYPRDRNRRGSRREN